MSASHDCRDRRATGMSHALIALDNMRQDLLAFATDPLIGPGVSFSVADRIGRLIEELAQFKARDLINARELVNAMDAARREGWSG